MMLLLSYIAMICKDSALNMMEKNHPCLGFNVSCCLNWSARSRSLAGPTQKRIGRDPAANFDNTLSAVVNSVKAPIYVVESVTKVGVP